MTWMRVAVPLLASLGLLAHVAHYDYVSDDAFIAARYARNLVEGQGLVFNPGERVEGFTSLLWVLGLSAVGALRVDYVLAMRAFGVLSALGCVWLAHRLAVRANPETPAAAHLAPVLVASAAPLACWAAGGLETCAFAFAILASLAVFEAEPKRRAAIAESCATAACVLLRPEGVLIPAALGLTRLSRVGLAGSLRAYRAWLGPVLALASLSAFRLLYFGDLVPNTARAKDAAAGGQWQLGLSYALDFVADHGHLGVWLGACLLALTARQSELLRGCALIALLSIAGVIWVGGDGLGMYRFFVPVLPLFAVMVSFALGTFVRLGKTRRASLALWAVGLASVLLLAGALALPDQQHPQYRLYDYQQRVEIPRWTLVGQWLAVNTKQSASVACVPIGAVGFYSRRVVRDMLGLTDRHIASGPSDPRIPFVGHRKHDGPYILGLKPTILLLGNVRVRKQPLPLSDPDFGRPSAPAIRLREEDMFGPELSRHYEPQIARLPSGEYLHYYRRRGAQAAAL